MVVFVQETSDDEGTALACLDGDICMASDVPRVVRRGVIEVTDSSRASTKDREATTVEPVGFTLLVASAAETAEDTGEGVLEVLVLFPFKLIQAKDILFAVVVGNPAPTTSSSLQSILTYGQQIRPSGIVTISPATNVSILSKALPIFPPELSTS